MITSVNVTVDYPQERLGTVEIERVYGFDHQGQEVDFDYYGSHSTHESFSEEAIEHIVEHVANWLRVSVGIVNID
jgi:hypothetical protein